MQARSFRRIDAIAIVAVILAIFAVATAAAMAFRPSTPMPMVGVATGEYVAGMPVYRLPTVSVTVSRKAELAKMADEEARALASARSGQ